MFISFAMGGMCARHNGLNATDACFSRDALRGTVSIGPRNLNLRVSTNEFRVHTYTYGRVGLTDREILLGPLSDVYAGIIFK